MIHRKILFFKHKIYSPQALGSVNFLEELPIDSKLILALPHVLSQVIEHLLVNRMIVRLLGTCYMLLLECKFLSIDHVSSILLDFLLV